MNVVITRAWCKLLLVGDSSTLCCHLFFVELLKYVKGVGGLSHSECGGHVNAYPILTTMWKIGLTSTYRFDFLVFFVDF